MRRMLLLAALVAIAGCAKHSDEARVPLTERQRDSVLAHSNLPGAFVVGHAMAATDRAARIAASQQATTDSLFH